MKLKSRSRAAKAGFFAFLAVASAALGAPACSGGDNPTPTTSSSSSSGGTTISGEGGTGTGGTGTGGTGTGGTGTVNCDGPNGCFDCPPKKTVEFLNACTDAQCTPFDNAARLPLYNGGNLPPLP